MGTIWPIYVRKKGKSLTGKYKVWNRKYQTNAQFNAFHNADKFNFTNFTVIIIMKKGLLEKLLFF